MGVPSSVDDEDGFWLEVDLIINVVCWDCEILGDSRGKKFGSINPECGLRQGDPLSPYLFILCAEGLSASLQLKENQGAIHGCRIARRAPIISHLFFADDSYLVFRAEVMEASTIKRCLKDYEDASGQMVNFQKSVIFSAQIQPHHNVKRSARY